MFWEKPNSVSISTSFYLNLNWAVCTPWKTGLGFSLKTWPLEPYFWKRSELSSRKHLFLQLSCFNFPQIRPLKASNQVIQKTALFWSELDSFRFKVHFTSYFAQTSSTDHIGSLKRHMQTFLTSPNIYPFVLTHPCKSVLVMLHQNPFCMA